MLYFWSISVALGIIFGGPCGKPSVADPTPPHSEQGHRVD